MAEIPRASYRRLLGPTRGDRIRLADTNLFIEVEVGLVPFGGTRVVPGLSLDPPGALDERNAGGEA